MIFSNVQEVSDLELKGGEGKKGERCEHLISGTGQGRGGGEHAQRGWAAFDLANSLNNCPAAAVNANSAENFYR